VLDFCLCGDTGSCHPLFVLGPVSFLAITRALFLPQVNLITQGVKKFPKYFELFWAAIRQITSYWGNMTSRKGYYASRDATKVYQSVSILLFSSMESVFHFCVCPWYTYILKLLPKVVKKRIQEWLEIAPGAPEPRGQRGQLPPLPKQCGGSTGEQVAFFTRTALRTSYVFHMNWNWKLFLNNLTHIWIWIPLRNVTNQFPPMKKSN
jgi:hypothetical protein